jgi:hypothetical protein
MQGGRRLFKPRDEPSGFMETETSDSSEEEDEEYIGGTRPGQIGYKDVTRATDMGIRPHSRTRVPHGVNVTPIERQEGNETVDR